MATADRQSYVQRLVSFLRSRYPRAAKLPDGGLRSVVDELVDKALQYDLRTEQQGAKYVLTAWLCGVKFDERFADARQVLTAELEPEEKVKNLEFWCVDQFARLTQNTGSQEGGRR